MKKDFDVLYDLTYDYDINFFKDQYEDVKVFAQANELSILCARMLCLSLLEEAKLFKQMHLKNDCKQRMTLLKDNKLLKKNKVNPINLLQNPFLSEKSEYVAFNSIKKSLTNLVDQGNPRALAKYLFCEKLELWEEEYIEKAKEIESSVKIKTPEEWEVVAALHCNDKVEGTDCDIKTYGKISYDSFLRYFKLFNKDEPCHKEYCDFVETKKHFMNTSYYKAVEKAQLGYYLRFLKDEQVYDLNCYFEMSQGLNRTVTDTEAVASYLDDHYVTFDEWAYKARKIFNKIKHKPMNICERYSFANIIYIETKSTDALKHLQFVGSWFVQDEFSRMFQNEVLFDKCPASDFTKELT